MLHSRLQLKRLNYDVVLVRVRHVMAQFRFDTVGFGVAAGLPKQLDKKQAG